MSVAAEFEVANEQYAAQFNKGDLPLPPGRYVPSSTAVVAVVVVVSRRSRVVSLSW